MAGQLTIDTLKASSGVLATQNGMTGIAKAWATFTGSTAVINGSFNISSVTRNSTGNYTVAFTTAMANANYSVVGNGSSNTTYGSIVVMPFSNASNSAVAPTSSSFVMQVNCPNVAAADTPYVNITVFSS
jgi:hypothetical protein